MKDGKTLKNMNKIYYILFLFVFLISCTENELDYGYEEPVVYFSKSGTHNINITNENVFHFGVYCSGKPKRKAIQATIEVKSDLLKDFDGYEILPKENYTSSNWTVLIEKNQQVGLFSVELNSTNLKEGKYILPLQITEVSDYSILENKNIIYLVVTQE